MYTPKELTWLGVAKEVTWGTAVAPAYYPPFKDAKPEDIIETVKDQGIRGALVQTFAVMQGNAHSTMDYSGEAYPDTLGLFLLAILGKDTVTGAASPYTHSFQLSRMLQPPPLTWSRYDGTNMRQFTGHMVEEISLKWAAKSALEITVKSQGKLSVIAATTTPSPSAATPFMGWSFGVTLGGAANYNLTGFDISLKRKIYPQYAANNTQSPTAMVAQALEVTGKATFDKADDTELNAFLNNTQPALVLTGTQGTNQLVIQMSKCAFIKDPVTGKEVVQGDVEFEGVDNATDNGPVLIKLTNAVASY